MIYLVDANVLSEATKPTPAPAVTAWLRRHEPELTVDPIILGEIRFGIHLLPAGARRKRLEHWFAEGVQRLNCLSWDAPTGLCWARLLATLRKQGHAMSVKDSMIAATALHYGLTIATHNGRDFANAGVALVDPFAAR